MPANKRPTKRNRPDYDGRFQAQYKANKKKILATQSICGICGRPVNKELKYPHPQSACIDHIIPIAKGGHPAAIENLQLTHLCCNLAKSDKLIEQGKQRSIDARQERIRATGNRNLPWSADWLTF